MRRTVTTLFLILFALIAVNAKVINVEDFIKKYSTSKNVTKVHIGRWNPAMWMINISNKMKIKDLLVYSLNLSSAEEKKRFEEEIDEIQFEKYKKIIKEKKGNENVLIAAKKIKKGYHDFILFAYGKEACIIKMKAKIDQDKIKQTMESFK